MKIEFDPDKDAANIVKHGVSLARAVDLRRRWTVMSRKVVFDEDNPEWTDEDFERAKPPHEVLPPEVLEAFPRTRGAQVTPKKIPVSIRLTREVVERFKASGPGWQTRMDEVLKKAVRL